MSFEAKRSRHVAVAIPELAHTRRHRRGHRASSARSRSSQMSRTTRPSSAGAAANRSIAASASATSPSAPRSSSVSTRTPVAGMPHASTVPSRTRSSRAARMSGMASSRSPRRALSRAEYTLTIANSARLCSRRRNTSLTSARSFCPRSCSAAVGRCTSATPSVTRAWANARSSLGSFGNLVGHPRSRAPRDRRPQHATRYSREVDVDDDPGVGHGIGVCGPWPGPAAGRLAIRDDPGNNGP